MKRTSQAFRINKRLAEHSWGRLSSRLITSLQNLTSDYGLSVGRGDIICLDGHWYITHSGLLRLASRRHCAGIQVELVRDFCDHASARWAFKATVFPVKQPSSGFLGLMTDPSNVSSPFAAQKCEWRNTRRQSRPPQEPTESVSARSGDQVAFPRSRIRRRAKKRAPQSTDANGNGGPKVRDRLCQIIRQHQLDATLVRSYATDFCGVKSLREATREQVENFVVYLADWAEKDRNALLCQLNSYLPRGENKEGAA